MIGRWLVSTRKTDKKVKNDTPTVAPIVAAKTISSAACLKPRDH